MNAKEFLLQIKKLDRLIENKGVEIQQLRDIANNTAVNMSGERVQSSGNHDTTANAICKYLDLENEIRKDIDKYHATKKDVLNVIEQLPALHYDLLHKIYVQGFTLKEVACKYDMSYSNITTLHGKALKEVQIILNSRELQQIV